MKAVRGEMPDTLTNCSRKWVWVPTPAAGGDGMLCLSQRPIKGGGVDLDTYGVEEIQAEYPRCRSFVFVNLTDETQQEPYRCTVGPVSRCSCDAGRKGFRRTSCKHRDAVGAMIVAGVLPAKQLQGA